MSVLAAAMGSTVKNLAVFIDADNLNDATALDRVLLDLRSMADRVLYRRAYGRPESLKGIEAVLWKHGVRPVANLIVDKVTTDGALVIDAVEAVCTNDIDTVAICSGDADFVPLAIWLREKGCKVICYSLKGKIFANPESFYDDVVVLEVVDATQQNVSKSLSTPTGTASSVNGASRSPTTPSPDAPKPGAAKAITKIAAASHPSVKAILAALPDLKNKQPVHLSRATKALRDAGLLGKSASSPPLFRRYSAQFELTPETQPNVVRYRG